jgi:hypothetical protein
MNLPTDFPVLGVDHSPFATHSIPPIPSDAHPSAAGASLAPSNLFEQVVRLVQSNDRLFAERDALVAKLGRARAYLAEPGCNRNFAIAHLKHLKLKHSCVLALLRANRLQARQILDRLNGETGEED